jgi:hypothetical protein
MPNQPPRRVGLARVSLRLVILAILGVAALAVAACSDDDGVSLVAPERELQGLWVRYSPPVGPGVAATRPTYDSLLVTSDFSGVWSHEVEGSMGIEPLRITEGVRIEQVGVRLFLFPLIAPCPDCRAESSDRMMALAYAAPFTIRRVDADHFVLLATSDAGTELRAHYERRPLPVLLEN